MWYRLRNDASGAEALKARRAVEAIHLKVRNMAGDAILAAEELGDITPQEHAVLGGLFARWKHKPADFDLLAEKFPAPSPARPAVVLDPVADAAE
jgi:hypothetical protein